MANLQKAAKRKLSNANIANQDIQANGNSSRSTNPGNSANIGRIQAGNSRSPQSKSGLDYRGGNWYKGQTLIGSSKTEDAPIKMPPKKRPTKGMR